MKIFRKRETPPLPTIDYASVISGAIDLVRKKTNSDSTSEVGSNDIDPFKAKIRIDGNEFDITHQFISEAIAAAIIKLYKKNKKNTIDHIPLAFGKHRGKTPYSLLDGNPSYIIWMYENVATPPCTKELYELAREEKENDDFMGELFFEYHAENYGDRD